MSALQVTSLCCTRGKGLVFNEIHSNSWTELANALSQPGKQSVNDLIDSEQLETHSHLSLFTQSLYVFVMRQEKRSSSLL